MSARRCSSIVISIVDGTVVLLCEEDGQEPLPAVMSWREAHKLASRLRKAANDASAMEARARAQANR